MLKIEKDELVKDYFSRIMQLVNQIRLFKENFEYSKVIEKILATLSEKFEAKILAIE